MGITALELYQGYPPYAHCEAMEAIIRTVQNDPPSFDIYSRSKRSPSRWFRQWIGMTLKKEAKERPKIDKMLSHSFLYSMTLEESKMVLQEFVEMIPDLDTENRVEEQDEIKEVKKKPVWDF